MELFRNCLDDFNLMDLGFSGPKYTWSNRQDAQCNVRVCLDRGVANHAFSSRFADCQVENVITTTSDHYAIVISLDGSGNRLEVPIVQYGFRYEAAWKRAGDYEGTVEEAWQANSVGPPSLQSTWACLNQTARALKHWSKVSFGSVRQKIQYLERRFGSLCKASVGASVIAEEREVEQQLCELFEREEIMARQRYRVEWLREGDRNTTFFYAKASARK
jgi:hypothetical protein